MYNLHKIIPFLQMLVFFYVVQITYANVNICILCESYHAFRNKLCNIMVSPQLYLVHPSTHKEGGSFVEDSAKQIY